MSFCLKPGENALDGLLRIVRSQIDTAAECLDHGTSIRDEKVHQARKSIKRARAALRLLRPALAASTFDRANVVLRDSARPLTHVRDARVLLDALASLRAHSRERAKHVPTDAVERALKAVHAQRRRQILGSTELQRTQSEMRKLAAGMQRWRLRAGEWDMLGAGIRRVYRNARRAYEAACAERSDERLHEWRKQVKYLWHGLQILRPLRPRRIGKMADQAHRLSDYLGDDHDLSVLRQRVQALEADGGNAAVVVLIDTRRATLQDRAFVLGDYLFEDGAGRVARRLHKHWTVWRMASIPVDSAEGVSKPKNPVRRPRANAKKGER